MGGEEPVMGCESGNPPSRILRIGVTDITRGGESQPGPNSLASVVGPNLIARANLTDPNPGPYRRAPNWFFMDMKPQGRRFQ